MNRLVLVAALLLPATAVLLLPATAWGGGIFVPGAGPQAQSRAGAFVAKADDPSALFHNPAGFAKTVGTVVYVGTNLVDFNLEFQRAGRYEDRGTGESYLGVDYPVVKDQSSPKIGIGGFQAIPIVAIATDFGMPDLPIRVGAGLFAPQGFPNREFPLSHDVQGADLAPGPQRYDVISQKAETVMPSIAVAYRPIDMLDIGVRVSAGVAKLKATAATWAIRNYEEWEQKDGIFEVDVTDSFVPAFGFGALFRPTDFLEFGASYHSALHIRATGTGTAVLGSAADPTDPDAYIKPEDREQWIDCALGGTVDALKACIDLDLPQFATVGARYILRGADGREKADIELDVRWENWGSTDASDTQVRVDGKASTGDVAIKPTLLRHGFQDVWSVRLGGSYTIAAGGNDLNLRVGVAHDTKTSDVNFNRADIDGAPRTTFGLGAGYAFGGRYHVDVSGGVVVEPERRVAQCLPRDGPAVGSERCDGGDLPLEPTRDRERPDPAQPLLDVNSAFESPYNAGIYNSGYWLLGVGFSASF